VTRDLLWPIPTAAAAASSGSLALALDTRLEVLAAAAELLEQSGALHFPAELLERVFNALGVTYLHFDHAIALC